MIKVLLAGSMNPYNKGDQARIKATIENLAGSEDISLSLLSHWFEDDKKVYSEDAIKIVKAPWSGDGISLTRMVPSAISALIKYSFLSLTQRRSGKGLLKYDAVVIASGIDFSDYAGRLPLYYAFMLITLFAIIMNKPVMCYSQSIGPVQHPVLRRMLRFFLNKTKTISVRDVSSLDFLNKLSVKQPDIRLTVDPAFMLTPKYSGTYQPIIKCGQPDNRPPLIGLSLSPAPFAGPGNGFYKMGFWYKMDKEKAGDLSNEYIQKMAYLCNRLIDIYGARLIFVPNCTSRGDDDRECMRNVYDRIIYKERAFCVSELCTLAENMRLIGSCDLFIGTRLHAFILAAIMGVPLVPFVGNNGPRIPGVMKSLGLDDYVRNVMSSDKEQLLEHVIKVWDTREQMRAMIGAMSGDMKKRAMENTRILEEFCFQYRDATGRH